MTDPLAGRLEASPTEDQAAASAVQALTRASRQQVLPWVIALGGLLSMFVPSFWDLFQGIWSTEQQGHGPIVLGISLWLLWRKWPEIRDMAPSPVKGVGWSLLSFGLLCYLIGRSQDVLLLEVGALPLLVVAVTSLISGRSAVRSIWFCVFFMVFMIPLPGALVDALTQPMKLAVSFVAESILDGVGYPISRTGVILQIGQYQLMVADACAGLHTLFTLEALGLLYLNLVRHESLARNVTLAIFIVPISFTANVIRVIVLTLVTYHFGDEAGQGFLHGFAGMVLFMAALLLIIGTDSLLRWGIAKHGAAS